MRSRNLLPIFLVWLFAVIFVCDAAYLFGQDSFSSKISPRILVHRAKKQAPPAGVPMAEHRRRLQDKGLTTENLDTEECAIYSERQLNPAEIAELATQGIQIYPDLWIPPVPGKHPNGYHLATVPYDQLDEIDADARFVRLESAEIRMVPNNDLGLEMIHAIEVQNGVGVPARNGAGVKIAIADSGFDLTHADLPVPVEKYDVTDGVGVATWGTNVANTVSAHGTHVAGTAVGSGLLSSGKYKGGAPGASLYLYKIGNDVNASATYTDMIEAINRAVLQGVKIFSMSYGGFSTYMDGSNSAEQAIDAATAAGMSCFISAGNDGNDAGHDSVLVAPGTTSGTFSFTLTNPSSSVGYTSEIDFYVIWRDGNSGDGNMVLNCTNLGSGEALVQNTSNASPRGTEAKWYELTPNLAASGSKTYTFTLQNTAGSGQAPLVHVYRVSDRGTFTSPDSSYTVGSPALADTAIAVGAWTQRRTWTNYKGDSYNLGGTIGTLASFSSRGPRIDGVLKPDIVAPGAQTISTRESVAGLAASDFYIIDNDGLNLNGSGPANYYVMQGTSMACPLAAGSAALLLQAAPSMTPAQLRTALTSTASQAGAPSGQVGYGLINILAAAQTQAGTTPQTITFNAIPDQIATNALTLSATGGASGNPVTFSVTAGPASITGGNQLSFTGAGTVSIMASQAGNATYAAAPNVTRTFQVSKANATVTLVGASLSQVYNGSSRIVSATTSPGSLPLTVTYGGLPTAPVNAGSYAVVATIDHALYQGSASGTLVVSKATATVTLLSLAQTYNNTPRVVTATTTPSTLPLTITYNGSSIAPTNAGSYPIVGTINHANYQGIGSGTLVVAKAAATVTLSNLNQVYTGGQRPATISTTPGGVSYQVTYNGFPPVPVNAGTYAVAVMLNDTNYQGSTSGTLIIEKAAQVIDFTLPAGLTATQTITLSATSGSSGNPVVYSVLEGPAQITGGNQLSFTGAGLVRIRATQTGGSNHYDATPAESSMTVTKTPAAVDLTGLNQVYTGNPLSPTATTTPGGLAVSLTFDGSPTAPTTAESYAVVATINDARYEGTASGTFVIEKAPATVNFTTLTRTYTGAPLAAVAVSAPVAQAINYTYNGLSTPPTLAGSYAVVATVADPSLLGSATGTFVIEKAPQTIDFDFIGDQFATETVVLTATGGGSGNPVLFEVVEGSAAISAGNLLTFSSEGTVSVRASQAGDANHLDAVTVTQSFNVTKFPATISLLNLTQGYTGAPRPAAYTTSPADLNVTLTYDGSSQAPTVPGSYFILAVIDEPYHQGDAGGFLTITKGVQAITFPAIPPQVATAAVTLSATGGDSGNPVTFEIADGPGEIDGNQLSFTASGMVTVRARQAGDTLYEAATPVLQSVTVNKAAASVEIYDLTRTYDGLPQTPSATTTPPGLSVSYTYDGGSIAPTGAGSYAVIASISDPRYEGSDTDTFVVEKAAQSIDFPPLANALANVSVPLAASGGGSGLPVIFEVTAGPASVQGGNSLVFSGAGEVTVTASQAGDVNHLAAPPVARTLTVSKAPASSLSLSALHQVFDGSPREVVVTSVPPGLASLVTYDGGSEVPTGTGSYAVVATLDDPIYEGSVAGTLVVDDPARLDLVPGGTLPALSALGSIDVPTFAMGRYEVTWGLWKQIRDWANQNGYDLSLAVAGCDDDHPVRGIDWFEAVKWCNARTEWENATLGTSYESAYRLAGATYRIGQPVTAAEIEVLPGTSGYRLPDAPEREYAARGGRLSTGLPYPGGVNAIDLAWHAANSSAATCDLAGGRGTRPVGGLLPNELGLYDLAGNIGEWSGGALTAAPARRLVFGGHWDATASALLHTALTDAAPDEAGDQIGFRVARSISTALASALDNDQIPWESGGAEPWHAQTGDSSDGIDAAAIGALGGEEASWVETTVTGPGNIAFSWKIQLPTGIGALLFAIDGEERARITGATAWADQSVYVPPGTHVIRWTYQRSLPQGIAPDPLPGANGAWLDAVAFTEAVAPTVTTGALTALGEEDGTGTGVVAADGGAPVDERGIVVSTESQPEVGSDLVFEAAAAGTGPFESAFTALVPGTTYRARAFANNAAGTGYGSEIVFTTDETVDLSGGTANRQREILSGDRHVFHFTLSSPRHADFSTIGGAALRAELYDENGTLLATFTGDGNFSLGELLYAGDYELHVYRESDGGPAQSYTLAFDVATEAVTLPDAAVGPAVTVQTGVGVHGSSVGQILSLSSKKAIPVSGVATFRNGGTLPDELILSGGGGSALFAVTYLGDSGNVTAQMLTGTLRTAALVEGDEPVSVTVSVAPNRKKLSKKKGKKKKIVTLKKVHALSIRAKSDFNPALVDEAVIVVRTF
jgi:subtilisin family serine protease